MNENKITSRSFIKPYVVHRSWNSALCVSKRRIRGMKHTTPNLPPNLPNEKLEPLPLETVKPARCDTQKPTCRQRENKLTQPRKRVSKRRTRATRLPRRGLPPPFRRAACETRGDWSARGGTRLCSLAGAQATTLGQR